MSLHVKEKKELKKKYSRKFIMIKKLLLLVASIHVTTSSLTNLALEYPQFIVQNPSGGFFLQTQNSVILAETTSGDISSISLTSPLSSATPYYNYVLPYMDSLDLLSRTTNS